MECCNSYTKTGAFAYAVVMAVTAFIVTAIARLFLSKPIDLIELSITAALVFIISLAVLLHMQSRCCKGMAKQGAK